MEIMRNPCWTPVSKLGCTELFIVEAGLKVDGKNYREVLLKKQMLPVIVSH